MAKYRVLDPDLTAIHQGDNTFKVVDGEIELPFEIAQDFIQAGALGNVNVSVISFVQEPVQPATDWTSMNDAVPTDAQQSEESKDAEE